MKLRFTIIICLLINYSFLTAQIIKTPVEPRPKGQNNVLRMSCLPIPKVRVAVIGTGMRGQVLIQNLVHIPDVEITAICDMLEKNTATTNEILTKAGLPKAVEYFGNEESWKKVTTLTNVDLVYVATDWKNHAKIGIQAMKNGKHVAIEVPGAMTMEEIWGLINTSEITRKHCMLLENCIYDFFELTTLNMAQHGLFGEILHAEGSYIHNLEPYWADYWNNWRLDYNISHRGDLYPTHGMGPACLALNIHRGDKLNYLISMDTKATGIPEYIKDKEGKDLKDFKNGDHTMTMIKTEKGKTIQIQHDVANPRPYSRMYQLTGTKGFANKYPVEGYALDSKLISDDILVDHKNLTPHNYVSNELQKALSLKYKNPIIDGIEEKAKQVGGHGGMDFILNYRLIHCLQKGLPLDTDVYDLAEWSCLVPLSEKSVENNSAPVEIPDFTRGDWNKLKGFQFSE